MVRACSMHGKDEKSIQISRESKWKRPHERHWHRWEDNIKNNLSGTGHKDVEWINLAQVQSSGGLL